jgi:branched-chain amino acid transport system permease protein
VTSGRALSRFRALPFRNEVAVLAAILLTTVLFQVHWQTVTLGIYAHGVSDGAALALQALGMVLVYRSNRIINFAQFAVGSTAATMFVAFVNFQPVLRLTRTVCPPCLNHVTPTDRSINYWLSLVLALGLALLLAAVIYHLVVRRFANAPPLVLTVATIFIAQALPALGTAITLLSGTKAQRASPAALSGIVRPPITGSFTITQGGTPVVIHATDVLLVAAALIAAIGLAVYLRRSATGNAIRAASENAARAGTLGVPVGKVTSRVWLLAGLLSAVAAILQTSTTGAAGGADVTTLCEILLVALIARLESLPIAAVAAIVIGIWQDATQWSFNSAKPLGGSLFFLIAVVLLVQRYRASRAEADLQTWTGNAEARPIPRELRQVSTVRKWRIGGLLAVIAVLGVYPWVTSPTDVELGTTAITYGMLGLSLLILTGWGGQISLGQFGFSAVGAYVAAACHLPFLLAILIGGLAGAVAAVIVGLPAIRLRGLHLAVISLAFALAVTTVLLDPAHLASILPTTLADPKLFGIDLSDDQTYYYLCLGLLVVIAVGVVGLRRTRTGRALIAARDNERGAQQLGISLTRLRLSGFAVSGFIAALAGGLLAYQQHGVNPQNFSPDISISVFLFFVIGGTGSLAGPLLGAAYAWLGFIGGLTPVLTEALTGVGGLGLLLFFPGGLAKVGFDLRDAGLRRIASRRRIRVPSLMADRDVTAADARAPIAAKQSKRGGTAFVPERYALPEQWVTGIPDAIVGPGETSHRRKAKPVDKSPGFQGLSETLEPTGASGG